MSIIVFCGLGFPHQQGNLVRRLIMEKNGNHHIIYGLGFSLLLYLEGRGGLVSRFMTPIIHIVTLAIPSINLLTKST